MPALTTFPTAPAVAQDVLELPSSFPVAPPSIVKRFGSEAETWNDDLNRWWRQTVCSLSDVNESVASAANALTTTTDDLRVQQGNLTLAITTEKNARITADAALTQYLITVFALSGSATNISVQSTAPFGPALNDIWVDNTSLTNPKTYYWNGVAWVPKTDFIVAAAVSDERTARIGADGNLSGKFTLTVIAGNVVTGMNITSSSGPGVNISSVIFRATDFLIYNGTTGLVMFVVSGTQVMLAGTLVVDAVGSKVYIGVGTFSNTNTSFYVDAAGKFSLKNNFTWDPSTQSLTIASTNRVLASDSTSFLTWQGPAGASTPGFYTQQTTAGGGFSAYGAGSGIPILALYRSSGSYGAPGNLAADSIIGTVFVEGYVAGNYNENGKLIWGFTANGNTPYFKIEVADASSAAYQHWIFNYDGKLYFTAPNDNFSPNSGIYAAPYVADPTANLFRASAGLMRTDGSFETGGGLHVSGGFQLDGSQNVNGNLTVQSNILGNGTSAIDLSVGSGLRISAGRTPGAGAFVGYINLVASDGTVLNVPFYS